MSQLFFRAVRACSPACLPALFIFLFFPSVLAEDYSVSSPDGRTVVSVSVPEGMPVYTVSYDGNPMLEASPLGLVTTFTDLSSSMRVKDVRRDVISEDYTLEKSKTSAVRYEAGEMKLLLANREGNEITVTFRVSDNNVALRYELPCWRDSVNDKKRSVRISREATGFRFPDGTTTFICPQSEAMINWKSTKPSYEEEYSLDAPMEEVSKYSRGYTFPCLFHIGENGWALVSETGLDSHYCACRLSDVKEGGLYTVEFPMPEENNGNGTVEPAMALPGVTPWRTITVGGTLAPIVETTAPWDNVRPLYDAGFENKYGKGTWSWILWQDESINYDDQVKYIDLSAEMGFQYVLVDNWWDRNIGRERMADLVSYAHSRGVDVFLWYSSSGYWNDIEQGPVNCMDNPIARKREMRWLASLGVKGIKVDFFGGDKQETVRLYESILSDAADYGLMVIFHGCTLPRGWERMYPNYVGSEAVLASENLIFSQHFCDTEAVNACLHPFIRNAVGCMEFGGGFLNRRLNRGNDGGSERLTTDLFEMATCVLFQNPVQNFAIAPNNLADAPAWALDFLKEVPTVWDETRFIDGYPGKYVILARRHGGDWYIAGVNAGEESLKRTISLDMIPSGAGVKLYSDAGGGCGGWEYVSPGKKNTLKVEIPPRGGLLVTAEN